MKITTTKLLGLLAMFSIISTSIIAQQLPESMYFRFDSAPGGIVANEAPAATRKGNATAVITGHTIAPNGQFGNRLQGNATTTHNVNTGWVTNFSGSWTISVWLQIPTPSTTRYLFGDNTAGSFRCFTGGVATNTGVTLRGPVTLDITGITQISATPQPFVLHYVYDATTTTLKGYVNGVQRASVTGNIAVSSAGPFYVANYTASGNSLEGGLDEFRMYNRALSQAEITATWASDLQTKATNNASISELTAPKNFCNNSTQDIKVKLKNTGTNILNNVTIQWLLDGIPQTPIAWTSPLDTFGGTQYSNDTIITLGSTIFTTLDKTLKVWTEYPNNVADTVNNDDTLSLALTPALSGTYTIGGTTPDYPSITAAVTALNTAGVCGPVTFNIRQGTYTGQFGIGSIVGASAVNTITFQSETMNRNDVTVSYNAASAGDNFLVKLNSSSYITFKHLTLTALSTSFAKVVELTGSASYNVIDSCVLNSALTTSSTSTDLSCVFTNGLIGSRNLFKNNVLNNSSYGIYWYGTSTSVLTDSNMFIGNTINNAYYYSSHFYYNNNLVFINNTISTNSAYNAHVGIRTYYCDGAQIISGNKVFVANGGYGLYSYYNDGLANNKGTIANNTFTVGGTSTTHGLRSYYASNTRFYNNTVLITNTTTSGYAAYFYFSSTTYNGNEVFNNIFMNTGGGYAMYNYNANVSGSTNIWDYNLIYSTGATDIQVGTPAATFATLNAYRATYPAHEKNSISYYVPFVSAQNLMLNVNDSLCWAANGNGIHALYNNIDINGNPRPTIVAEGAPDLGAYEFTPQAPQTLATAVPATPVAGGTQAYLYGTDTIAKITWDALSNVPAYAIGRLYQGAYAPGLNPTTQYALNVYWDFEVPVGSYNYTISLYYRNTLLGSIPNEANMVGVKQHGMNPWISYGVPQSSVDTVRNILTISGLTDFSLFTGTDATTPLPVKLTSFTATPNNSDVSLIWHTASERNAARFEVYTSTDGRNFEQIGTVKAKGNSNLPSNYRFIHSQAMRQQAQAIYYKLKLVDVDGTYTWSNHAIVKLNRSNTVSLHPNPFTGALTLQLTEMGTVQISVANLQGKTLYSNTVETTTNTATLTDLQHLQAGIYFVSITQNGNTTIHKVVKQ